MNLNKHTLITVLIIILVLIFTQTTQAKSVYVITKHVDNKLTAYDIQADQIDWQATADVPPHVSGPVGLALDPDFGVMFVIYEDSEIIEMVNARTLAPLGKSKTVTGATNLAGIAFDKTKQKLYVLKRQDNRLYIYLWNPITRKLTLEGETYKTLANLGIYGAYGIALDESNDRLYVTDGSITVNYYNTNDPNFGHKGSIDIVVDTNDRSAVGIAIDPNARYLYTGSWWGTGGGHTFLVRTDISDINNPTFDEKNVGAYVIGITVDEETGFVYTTDNNDNEIYEIKVFDTATFPSDPCHIEDANISKPADIIIAGDMSYKLPLLKLTKVDNAGLDNRPSPGDYITYTITYDANGHSVNNVNIVDYLPDELDFNSASGPNSVYGPNSRTVTWQIGTLSPTDTNYVTLSVKVDPNAPTPLEIIINFCEMESDSTYNSAYCWTPAIIYVDADANDGNDTGRSWENAYLDLQDALETTRTCGCKQIWVAEGTYYAHTDTGPGYSDVAFELINGVALYGGFAGYGEPDPDDRDFELYETILEGDIDDDGDSETKHVVKAADVNEATVLDGFTIKRGYYAGIKIDGASPTIKHTKIIDTLGGASPPTYPYGGSGLYCRNASSPIVESCEILNCNSYGIYCKDSEPNIVNCEILNNGNGVYTINSDVNVSGCIIRDNDDYGINCGSLSIPVIKNNWICNNGSSTDDYGIRLDSTSLSIVVRNNTIANNDGYGIRMSSLAYITNCIVWGNGNNSLYYENNVTYSCIDGGYDGKGNIAADPCFVDDPNDPNNYHLSSDWDLRSPCIDAGDPNFTDSNETDIDGQPRVMGDCNEIVDMGADETYFPSCWNCPSQCHADSDCDGSVNIADWVTFRDSYGKNYCDHWNDGAGPYNPCGDYNRDGVVDIVDWPEFRDNFGKEVPNDCNCGCAGAPEPNCWPLDCSEERGGGGGKKSESSRDAEYELFLDELVEWLEDILADDQLKEAVGEDEWQKFIESVADFIETLAE